MSKVCEESNKIIDDMLAKKYVDGELDGEVHVSISIGNDEIDNVDTVGMARGIKARHCSRKGRKRVLSWVEKLAKKTKRIIQFNPNSRTSCGLIIKVGLLTSTHSLRIEPWCWICSFRVITNMQRAWFWKEFPFACGFLGGKRVLGFILSNLTRCKEVLF
ncbi:hypothetical protein P8452_36563 [Trifolium repens]|nr:hypothetical protein P8452_36563 [Trifolium repens]